MSDTFDHSGGMSTHDAASPRMLGGRFLLGNALGEGAFAVVYEAKDLKHNRKVAIKVLKHELAHAVGSERFRREIAIESRLEHPNILTLLEAGLDDEPLYYVMPFVEGTSLGDYLRRKRQLSIEEVMTIAEDIAAGLDYAHQRGVLHRDIKPDNIMLAAGRAMIVDFGLAAVMYDAEGGDEKRITSKGLAVGTPEYMSPEQGFEDGEPDGRADQYSLACVVFEMLTGDPPFTGRDSRALLARKAAEPPPPVRTRRPGASDQIARSVEKALSPARADRFDTAADFIKAMRTGVGLPPQRRLSPWVAIGAVVVALIVAFLVVLFRPSPTLDPRRIVMFPPVIRSVTADSTTGDYVQVMIETAFVHASPLKLISGADQLTAPQRRDPSTVTAVQQRVIARRQRAAHHVTATVQSHGDSITVLLELQDVAEDTLIRRSGVTGSLATPLHHLVIDATKDLIPAVVDPGRAVDLEPVRARRADAIALWVLGERAYRNSRFHEALEFYQRAVAADSAMAFAAFKGAQAASWLVRLGTARELIGVALANRATLPDRYENFATGLDAYLRAEADSAVARFQRALRDEPEWAEAQMALGEVHYHYMPKGGGGDSLALRAFETALSFDEGFTPPLFHLAELAVRSGDTERAAAYLSGFADSDPTGALVAQLTAMIECVADEREPFDWTAVADVSPLVTLRAGATLGATAAQPSCAEGAFRAVLGSSRADPGEKWGALNGLQGTLVAQGRAPEAAALIDSALTAGVGLARILYLVNALAGEPFSGEAEDVAAFARSAFGHTYERVQNAQLQWLLGSWHLQRGEQDIATVIARRLSERAVATGDRRTVLYANALNTQLLAAAGDTAAAIAALQALTPTGDRDTLSWQIGEAHEVERLMLARILFARGEYQRAITVADALDHPVLVAGLPFVAPSLQLRLQAARAASASQDLEQRFRQRLIALGRLDLIDAPTVSLIKEEP